MAPALDCQYESTTCETQALSLVSISSMKCCDFYSCDKDEHNVFLLPTKGM